MLGSLLDYIQKQAAVAELVVKTKEGYGAYLHDPDISDEDKKALIEKVEQMGGYACLV